MCSEACECNEWHKDECEILSAAGIACDIYDFEQPTFSMDVMGPLRLILAMKKSNDPRVRLYLIIITQLNNNKHYLTCHDNLLGNSLKSMRIMKSVRLNTESDISLDVMR